MCSVCTLRLIIQWGKSEGVLSQKHDVKKTIITGNVSLISGLAIKTLRMSCGWGNSSRGEEVLQPKIQVVWRVKGENSS